MYVQSSQQILTNLAEFFVNRFLSESNIISEISQLLLLCVTLHIQLNKIASKILQISNRFLDSCGHKECTQERVTELEDFCPCYWDGHSRISGNFYQTFPSLVQF